MTGRLYRVESSNSHDSEGWMPDQYSTTYSLCMDGLAHIRWLESFYEDYWDEEDPETVSLLAINPCDGSCAPQVEIPSKFAKRVSHFLNSGKSFPSEHEAEGRRRRDDKEQRRLRRECEETDREREARLRAERSSDNDCYGSDW